MTYYSKTAYNERYNVQFKDIDGNDWYISIADPTFSGNATELTGAENPVEWFGVGDESQTDVVLGSTGTLRLICLDGQSSIFTQGALLPDVINERRVTIKRWFEDGGGYWDIIWQGFIKPEQYTQDWDRAPYEIELPIVSAIAATEFIPMPDYENVEEKDTIADLLWYVLDLTGCDFEKIITNKPVYEDFNGNPQYPDTPNPLPYHWTQSYASTLHFYDYEGDGIKPKMLKDVLETICYPYGKIFEYRRLVAVMMSAGKYIYQNTGLYYLQMNTDSPNYHRFVHYDEAGQTTIELPLSSFQIAGTDNKISLVSRPESVNFTSKLETDDDIFEMSDDLYKAPITVDVGSLSGNPSYWQYNEKYRALYRFDDTNVDTSFCSDLEHTTGIPWIFCRVVDVDGTDTKGYTYNTLIPLGLFMGPTELIMIELNRGVRTVELLNMIKLSMRIFAYPPNYQAYGDASNAVHGTYTFNLGNGDTKVIAKMLVVDVTDSNNPQYLDFSAGENHVNQWSWKPYDNSIDLIYAEKMQFGGDTCYLTFNEPRDAGDNKPHKLRVYLSVINTGMDALPVGMFMDLKLEYVRDNSFTTAGLKRAFEEVNDSIEFKKQISETGGARESLTIDFKTMCGRNFIVLNGSAFVPYNSFCDATKYIDVQNRKMLELGAVKFDEAFVQYPFLVTDNTDVYVPVAFGMNPRMNTCRFTLVTTNIAITQPS